MNNQQQNNQQDNERKEGEGSTDTSAVYTGDSTLQSKAEFEQDKKGNYTKDDAVASSGVDDLQSNSYGAAGTDRAGTAERKKYGDTELNKGLEAQAEDEES